MIVLYVILNESSSSKAVNMLEELHKKYFKNGFTHYTLSGDREKLWLCWKNNHLFEKKSDKTCSEICPKCGNVAFQPSERGFREGSLIFS